MFPRYLMKTLMSEYNWLQGSVATYLRCDGVVNNQIKKGLLLSLPVKNNKSVNIWQGYMQEGGCLRLVHFLRLLLVWWPGESAPPRDARIAFFNIRILSVSIKNYPYPIRSDVDNWYPYPIRIRGSTMVQYDTVSHPHCSSQVFPFELDWHVVHSTYTTVVQ